MNLIEGLQEEINRVRIIIKEYDSIPEGFIASRMMSVSIKYAENSIAMGDTIRMLKCLEDLKSYEL